MSGNLSHMPAEIVEKLLADLTLGSLVSSDDDWPIYVTFHPDGSDIDDNLLSIYNTASSMQSRVQYSGEHVEYFGIQILVRSTAEEIGWEKSKAILEAMDKTVKNTTVTISTSTYLVGSMNRTGGITSLGVESETRRRKHSLNYLASITQTS